MWSPTHIQVTIHSARGVLIKGKGGVNNCFVTIGLGKEKFQTSVQKNAVANVEWREECELRIPDRGNRAELVLTCMHKGAVVDDFLGQVTLPLNEMDVYERPRQRWYRLESKPGHEKKDKDRGELEVRIAFTVNPETGSTADLSKKSGSRLGLGGSLLSLGGDGEKRNKMKNFAKSLGSRLHLNSSGKGKISVPTDGSSVVGDGESVSSGSVVSVNQHQHQPPQVHQPAADQPKSGQLGGLRGPAVGGRRPPNADPGVVSDDEDDFVFDNMSHKSSGSSLNVARSQQQLSGGLPPPSPLARHDGPPADGPDDVQMRSQTLPAPSKPPRATPEPPASAAPPPLPVTAAPKPADEWEAKLYGGKQLAGSVDSLKRRSWESSRVIPITVDPPPPSSSDKPASGEHVLASTAPSTPNLGDQKRSADQLEKPTPLPRSATLESIEEKTAVAAPDAPAASPQLKDKEKDKMRIMQKFKYFQRKDRSEEDLKNVDRLSQMAAGRHQQLNERIIIGHENEMGRRNALGAVGAATREVGRTSVSPELQQKYDGKTREDMLVLANDLENEVKSQKLKMKEMEDYLDDLLLRVMETHPKILQNPYRNQTSAKSG